MDSSGFRSFFGFVKFAFGSERVRLVVVVVVVVVDDDDDDDDDDDVAVVVIALCHFFTGMFQILRCWKQLKKKKKC